MNSNIKSWKSRIFSSSLSDLELDELKANPVTEISHAESLLIAGGGDDRDDGPPPTIDIDTPENND